MVKVNSIKYSWIWNNNEGLEKWPDGSFYDGDYYRGRKSGKGKFVWADACIYEGQFKDNKMEGNGY